MYPSDTIEADEQQGGRHTWRAIRWLITAAASLMLVTLFLTQGTSTEAAAPAATAPAATDTAVYHEMDAACPQGFNCIANNCLSGNYNFCYNLNYAYPYNFGAAYGCGIGGLNCGIGGGVNFVYPSFVNYNGFYNGVNRFPVFINPNNACNVGNFTCYNANACNVGNFSCFNANGCNVGNFSCFNANGCNVGNFSCANANFPFFGNPFFFNGNAVPTVATTAVGANKVTVTSNTGQVVIYNPREIAPTVQVAPVAAPAAPAANYATPLNAPAQAPAAAVTSGGDIHVLSAAPATKPAVTTDADDHRG
ncbi:MAG: hypothetical protein M3176_04910 [Chloroflexota bacterium]|nr:hypothetical protein [Chloroflexota bacterium]